MCHLAQTKRIRDVTGTDPNYPYRCNALHTRFSLPRAASTENMKPVCEQDVCVLRSAQVHDLVGVFLWKCHEENKVGGDSGVEIDQKGVDAYELRDIEDGVPSLDWPPLPGTQDLSKFAFDTMAMVRVPRKEKKKIKKEYVVVTTPGGRSTVPIDLDCTVSELLKMVSLFILSVGKRMDDFEPSDTHQKEQSAEKNEREEKFKTYTSESFAVYKKMNIFGKKEEMVFVIEGDKLSIIPTIMDSTNSWTPRSTWNDLRMAHGRHTPQKLLYYNMDDVVRACLVPEKSDRTFQFVVASKKPVTGMTEYNTHEFETKRVEDVARVIRKMDRILNTRKSEARTNYDAYLEAQEAAPKRRWV
ncbi:hypothetical protein SARC_08707 [Sphaeroforma arctica JP610]|uniref:Uncharacterized protein n=1 Tax=Sphaeroforma arctica JP610 TaxID=667725 RepID=A0A0L0FPZ9_9EUKA|nr:hypothetical protein SARC_08707 [Sphaeroforma arctica JP610]KNC78877.1 hypothetical protein SARC_08707 [Sphaeroforma arctica JP610]|eukprot:XP_014152779.1 hypothetical protein SARC_08707 [Sphaeroforma arctica JP610]